VVIGRGKGRPLSLQPPSTTVMPSGTPATPTNSITSCQAKLLRNRADYAIRKCVKNAEEVTRLKDEQAKLLQIQKNQEKDHKVNQELIHNLEKKLSTNDIASSKLASRLKGRSTRLSTALINEKEKGRLLKKGHTDQIASLQDQMNAALKQKESKIRNMATVHKSDMDKAVQRVREQGRNRVDTLRQQLTTQVKVAHDNGEKRLRRSQKANSAVRERLKVSVSVSFACSHSPSHILITLFVTTL